MKNLMGWLCGVFMAAVAMCHAVDIDPANATPVPANGEQLSETPAAPDTAPVPGTVPGSTNDPFSQMPAPTPDGGVMPASLNAAGDDLTNDMISSAARRAARLPSDDVEIRGLEVLSSVSGFQTRDQVRELNDQIVAGGFNRVYPEVRTAYGVAIESRTEQVMSFISPAFPNPAAEMKAQLAGTASVFPLVSVLPAYSAVTGIRPLPDNILAKFPAFGNRSVTGEFVAPDNQVYLDPGSTPVQDYLSSILLEIDTQILPDGYLLSGISYPGKDWGYSERAVSEFRSIVGGEGPPPPDDPTWTAYRRDQLTKLLKRLKATVTKDRPSVKFSVLITVDGMPPTTWEEWQNSTAYADHMQDWIEWLRNF
ncbi:MAG: family 10 glycosylhydrolase, partial [Candidatus Sumerlaeota bacterium]